MLIKKAIFPVAGIGSRFLPATKVNPKEMLPIVDKPLIQYAVEEAVRAGISHMIFVTSSGKRAIEDHFDRNLELERLLCAQGRDNILEIVKNVSPLNIKFTYVRQHQPLGLGHAILCAQHVVGDDPFAVLLADDLIDDSKFPCLSAMIEHFSHDEHSVLAVQNVPWCNVSQYGVVRPNDLTLQYAEINNMVEKPKQEEAPSNLAAIGRYVFTPDIFTSLKQTSVDHHNEIQLTGGIQHLLTKKPIYSYNFGGKRYDCGSKLGYLQAIVELGVNHKEIGGDFSRYIEQYKLQDELVCV